MTAKNDQFLGPYKQKKTTLVKLNCIDAVTAFTVAVVPAKRYELSMGARFVTSTGVAAAAVAGDDATFLVSVDGVNFFVPSSVAGTAVVLGADDNGRVVIEDTVTHIRASNAQLAADETQVINIMCIDE
jgi:hypothetical protein